MPRSAPNAPFDPPAMLTFTRPGLIAVCYCSQTEVLYSFRPDGTYTPNEYASCKGDESPASAA